MTMRNMEQTSDERVVLMVSTYAGAAHFIPHVREALAEMWPGHPPLRFLTDGGAAGPDVILGSNRAFVPLMAQGLSAIRKEFPGATHVFHMLEDHCPLRRCEEDHINAGIRAALTGELPAVVFVTYEWLPYFSNEIAEIAGEKLIVLPKSYFRYYQVQPTLWRIDYLERVLGEAERRGISDPWSFEAMQLDNVERHLISKYSWPTVHHGFLTQGKIHHRAIDYADREAKCGIRTALLRELVGVDSEAFYRLHRFMTWLASLPPRLRAKLSKLRKPVDVS